jgi:Zn-dependent metalloprotease
LIVYAPGDRPPRLGWQLSIPTDAATRWLVVIDALDGTVLTAFDEVPDTNVAGSGLDLFDERLTLNVWSEDGLFYLVDTSKPMYDVSSDPPRSRHDARRHRRPRRANQPDSNDPSGIPELAQVSSTTTTAWAPPDAVSAAAALADVYDYYLARHARNSIDGSGGSLLAIVRLGRGYANAFWSGSYMAFGDAEPYAGSLDVVGHELTHGVTQYSANLIYRDEPGALNEAFSDIFGESVEAFITGSNDWQVGSRLSAPLRDMADPNRFGDPATYSELLITTDDNGGVHSNSGILNHAFYLLADGLSGGGIGLHDAERIFYRALTVHLVANSRYIDARLAAVASARELFGEGSRQAERTGAAFDAVEVFAGRGTPNPQPFPGVAGEDATLFVYYDRSQDAYLLGPPRARPARRGRRRQAGAGAGRRCSPIGGRRRQLCGVRQWRQRSLPDHHRWQSDRHRRLLAHHVPRVSRSGERRGGRPGRRPVRVRAARQ